MVRPTTIMQVKISDIQDLPYTITIPIKPLIKSFMDIIKAGGKTSPVSIARADGKLYPVDKLDVLHAYRESGSDAVPCVVTHVDTVSDAQSLHINCSRNHSVNPFILYNAVDYIKARNDKYATDDLKDWEQMKIADMPLVPEIKEKMSEYITSLGERMEYIPSFFAMFKMITNLEEADQVSAMDTVLKSCERLSGLYKYYAVPDPTVIANLIGNFRHKNKVMHTKTSAYNDDDGTKKKGTKGDHGSSGKKGKKGVDHHGNEEEEEEEENAGESSEGDGADQKGKAADPDEGVKVHERKEKLGYYHTVDPNSIHFKCKRDNEYVFNGKSLIVREYVDKGKFISLEGDHGSRMYAIRPDAAEYMELSMQPSVQYYFTSNKQHGTTVIITKKNLPEEILDKIKAILNEV